MENDAGNGRSGGSERPVPEPAEAGFVVLQEAPDFSPGDKEIATKEDLPLIPAPEPAHSRLSAGVSTGDKETATKEDLPSIPAPEEPVAAGEPTLRQPIDQTLQMREAPKWDTIQEQASPQMEGAPDTTKEQAASPSIRSESETAPPPTNNETKTEGETAPQEKAPRPKRPAQLETALTATALVIAASIATWMLARPATLLFPPTQEQAAQLGQSPDCRRVRFDVEQLLGDRWRQIIASCLRGSCDSLRETLLVRNFPVSTWQLIEADDSGDGCEVNAQGAAKSPECTRLAGRIEGVAKAVLLQVEGECREKL